ncbi:MAG: sulfite oxidase-like oxidoreductase [Rhodospirillaceae bacterium]|nr:sulfite oxidase-like oxidoreductase [Rhodospirillaceae bacterium]
MPEDSRLGGKDRQKLVEAKQKWAQEGRLLTGKAADGARPRLPPGQRHVTNWPILDLGFQVKIESFRWRLVVDGAVENQLNWGWLEFRTQPQVQDVSDIHCVTSWSRYDNHWEGVSAKHLLSVVRPHDSVKFVIAHSYDGYTTNIPLAQFADSDVLLAHSWEGKPIHSDHGGPMRLIVPKLYFWKSAKWVRRLEFTIQDRPGFWEARGYHNHGDPWKEERYG